MRPRVHARALTAFLGGLWVVWISWGAKISDGSGRADASLESSIHGIEVVVVGTVFMTVLAGVYLIGRVPRRWWGTTSATIALWWVFLAATFFAAELALASGLSAAIAVGCGAGWWNEPRWTR